MKKNIKAKMSIALSMILVLIYLTENTSSRLVQMIQIIRHGAREPMAKYKNKLSTTSSKLTNEGFSQVVNLGRKMSKKYAKKLKMNEYQEDHVKVVSSERDRCFHSAKGYLQGFFTKQGEMPEHSEYMHQVEINGEMVFEKDPVVEKALSKFKVNKLKPEENQMFRSHSASACPNSAKHISDSNYLQDKMLEEYVIKIYQKLKEEGVDIDQFLTKTGNLISSVSYLYDYYYCEHFWHLKISEFPISTVIFHMIRIAKTYIWYKKRKARIETYRASVTPLVKSVRNDVIQSINDYKSGKKNRKKLVLYSGQDNVMFSLLNVMDQSRFDCFADAIKNKKSYISNLTRFRCAQFPSFADTITFELHHFGLSFIVRVYHNKKKVYSGKAEEFEMYMKGLASINFKGFCYGKDIQPQSDSGLEEDLEIFIYESEKIRQQKKLKDKEVKEKLRIIKAAESIFGKRAVQLGFFAIFCGALFISFKYIYGDFAAKRKLKNKRI